MKVISSFFPLSCPSNSVGVAYTDDGQPYGGRGGAVWNYGESSTILFNKLAIFKDNVGALVREEEKEVQRSRRGYGFVGYRGAAKGSFEGWCEGLLEDEDGACCA